MDDGNEGDMGGLWFCYILIPPLLPHFFLTLFTVGWEWLLLPVVLWKLCTVQIHAPSPGCTGTAGGALGTCGSWSQLLPRGLYSCTQGQHFFSLLFPTPPQYMKLASPEACSHPSSLRICPLPLWRCALLCFLPHTTESSFSVGSSCIPYLSSSPEAWTKKVVNA